MAYERAMECLSFLMGRSMKDNSNKVHLRGKESTSERMEYCISESELRERERGMECINMMVRNTKENESMIRCMDLGPSNQITSHKKVIGSKEKERNDYQVINNPTINKSLNE